MFRTLYARLAAVLVGLFLVIGLLYVLIITSTLQSYLQELSQHFNRDLAQRIVADRGLVASGRLEQEALKKTFSAYMDINPSIEIYLLDHNGRILAYSADPGKVKRQRVDLAPIRAFLHGAGFPLLGDDPRSHDRRKAFSVTQVPGGYLYVVLRGEEYDMAEQAVETRYALRLSVWAAAGSLGFGLMAGLLLFHLLTRRLQRLAGVMEAFQQSGFTHHAPSLETAGKSADEVDRLGQTFDEMAKRIIDQWGQLRRQDRLRREMVAQVSHDLRTPLAAMHGYLQTLQMKQDELAAAQRQEFLTIALRQSERMIRMVEDLFELAQLEAKEMQPVLEPTSLAELVQDVVQKFQLRAEGAGVQLAMARPESLPVTLLDIALTERLLDNLISNAIDHTPAGGHIEIVLTQEALLARVSVLDDGPGIPTADLPRLFDPFYRSPQANNQGGHAGLGLAIAKRIAELQGGELQAANRTGGGACFTLSLPVTDS
ncbi:MAG: ATP-binding protein [Chromatiales bacterium]|jgi:signal transduction histidine kinase